MRLPTAFSGLVHTLVQQDPAFGTWVQLHRGTGQGDLTALALISTLPEAAVLWVSLGRVAASRALGSALWSCRRNKNSRGSL